MAMSKAAKKDGTEESERRSLGFMYVGHKLAGHEGGRTLSVNVFVAFASNLVSNWLCLPTLKPPELPKVSFGGGEGGWMRLGRRVATILMAAGSFCSLLANKVILIQNPWVGVPVLETGTPEIFGLQRDVASGPQFQQTADGWWLYDFGPTAPGSFSILNKPEVWSRRGLARIPCRGLRHDSLVGTGSRHNLDALFASSDTVWMVPSPAQGGPPRLLVQRPNKFTVLFWNLWEGQSMGFGTFHAYGSASVGNHDSL
jgi:hypothetical protein